VNGSMLEWSGTVPPKGIAQSGYLSALPHHGQYVHAQSRYLPQVGHDWLTGGGFAGSG
jgi:hypothetical protein